MMNDKTKKFVNVMYKILGVAPVIALAVFTVLFTFVLKDRLEERILHSATTFLLWMFASVFYIMVRNFGIVVKNNYASEVMYSHK